MAIQDEVELPAGDSGIQGLLTLPPGAQGLVVFAHGSRSSRFSPRNAVVAAALVGSGFATLLLDLLTPREEADDRLTGCFRFDMRLLADRVVGAIDWLAADALVGDLPPAIGDLPIGCFGASTGAAAALVAAAERPDRVAAVVSRGGRPDLAEAALPQVKAPTLLIVGSRDADVLELNRQAQQLIGGEARLEVVPGATHLFEEPGALERVALAARDWFERHLHG
jgi:pimeloyl-ACP methyl ester carboxylesterase